jgi:hypothetical protein
MEWRVLRELVARDCHDALRARKVAVAIKRDLTRGYQLSTMCV